MKSAPPIATPMWLTIGDALSKLATELLGEPAPKSFLTHPNQHERLHRDAMKDFRKAIESGQVTVHIDGGKGVGVLTREKARHFATSYDVSRSTVCVEGYDEWIFNAEVNASELDTFLRRYRASRRSTQASIDNETACKMWLAETLPSTPPGGKQKLRASAIDDFEVSGRAFDRVWKALVSNENFSNHAKSGRPKKSAHQT